MMIALLAEWLIERIERIRAWIASYCSHRGPAKSMRYPNGMPRVPVYDVPGPGDPRRG